jgi:hypothetical protein
MHKALLLAASCLLAACSNVFAQTATTPLQVRLICYDLLIYPADLSFGGGVVDSLRVSAFGKFNDPNDEASFAPPDIPSTHWGAFHYFDGFFQEGFAFDFEMNIPGRDANNNGVFDLVEFGQSVPSTTTVGDYFSNDIGDGKFQTVWSKNANSARGTVRIIFDFNGGQAFVHTFEILNFTGAWTSATKENTTVHGPITLTRSGTPTSTLKGELALSVNQQEVKLTTTSLKDENDLTFTWAAPTIMERDGTEFYEFLNVTDGWLYEFREDFHDWLIIVDDQNDTDGDGLPNLIDPPSDVPPTAPSMQIIKTDNGIRLVITGDVGRAYTLESVSAVPAATWSNATAVTLTTSPFTVDLPAPTSPTFWRMRFP